MWERGLEEDHFSLQDVGNKVSVAVDGNEEHFLFRILLAVGMGGRFPEFSGGEKQRKVLEGDASFLFQPFVLLGIPVKNHGVYNVCL